MKVCIMLVSICVLVGCAARPQIECIGKDGTTIYLGPYDHESGAEFIVQEDQYTRTYYSKAVCQKLEPRARP